MIELRSDTFTVPTHRMRAAMAAAPVGDDVYGEDPTVNRLERLAADRLGAEAGCLMPSGTMANLAAILAHVPRGSTVLVGSESDVYLYQAAGAAVCGGIGYQPITNRADGTLAQQELAAALAADPADPQLARPALVCLENTQNRCGGVVLGPDYQAAVAELAHRHGIGVHLDGARIFNAAVASGLPVAELARHADTVQFCLSKGLRAPIGSMLVGTAPLVAAARRIRKMLGGGMRQAGVIAAAGIIAMEEMVDRLADDHALARRLAAGLAGITGVAVEPEARTNIVLFRVLDHRWSVEAVVAAARAAGVAVGGFGHGRLRAVTHADVTAADVDQAVEALARIVTADPPDDRHGTDR